MTRAHLRGLAAVLLVNLAGCGGTESPTSPGEVETPLATTVALSSTALSFSSFGETQQLTATVMVHNGAPMGGASVVWASSASAVATVSPTGVVAAVADGTATITATSGSASETASVSVQQGAASITLSPISLILAGPGDAATVTASVTDAGGSEIANPALTWSSDAEAITTVSSNGLVTAVAAGTATVTAEATSGGQTVAQAFTVSVNADAQPPQPEFPPGAIQVPPEQVDTLFRSPVSGLMDARREVVRSSEAWADVWAEVTGLIVPTEPIPDVDFSTSQVLVLAMGTRPSGGYAIDVGAIGHADDTLYVVVREVSPGAGCLTTQSLTQPVLLLRIPLLGGTVEFIEEQVVLDCA